MKTKGLKSLFEEHFREYSNPVDKMYFRWYNPQEEDIVSKYTNDDWQKIFPGMVEGDLKDISTCANVVILVWCDRATNTPRGMVYLEENFHKRGEVIFHGGTWDHDRKYFKEIFRSLVTLLDFILLYKYALKTTCSINNRRADKFQESLCFKEVARDRTTIYKSLDKLKYEKSIFVNSVRTISV
ncbi:MAG: hypothetical protein ACI31F_06870 [Muribaculaceae bacterium]